MRGGTFKKKVPPRTPLQKLFIKGLFKIIL